MIELIAFLGNPGTEYAGNRHNAGRLVAAAMPPREWKKRYKGLYAADGTTHFIMPETFMNLSGDSVVALTYFFKIPVEHILVVHDELDLPLGTVSLKYSGGLNGHNGLRSLKARLGSGDFWRFRIGIGRPEHGSVFEWVLSDFSNGEKLVLAQVLPACAELIQHLIEQEPEPFLPYWAKKKLLSP
ncbi:MAG: aminoacyl-tRNA hydrolase [Spirochaetaceae bacterium]|jgi:PTH1 family peptidyl-tRNA hydrolase|nr:aminoacyl-tRNA hydrolase [Spirochaetaceae bacterium]